MTIQHANQRLADDLKIVLRDAEDLLRATADAPGKKLEAARERLAGRIAAVRRQQTRLQEKMSDALRASGRVVREHPYETAAGGGLALLLLAAGITWLVRR